MLKIYSAYKNLFLLSHVSFMSSLRSYFLLFYEKNSENTTLIDLKTFNHSDYKMSKRVLYNKKKLASVNTSAVGLGNSTKLFFNENLTDCNNKLIATPNWKLKRASLIHSIFIRDGVVRITKSNHNKSK